MTPEELQEINKSKLSYENAIKETKQLRKDLDAILQRINGSNRYGREVSLCVTKLQEAIMWLGMDLKALGAANQYQNSYNPENSIIEPTSDGLKM